MVAKQALSIKSLSSAGKYQPDQAYTIYGKSFWSIVQTQQDNIMTRNNIKAIQLFGHISTKDGLSPVRSMASCLTL